MRTVTIDMDASTGTIYATTDDNKHAVRTEISNLEPNVVLRYNATGEIVGITIVGGRDITQEMWGESELRMHFPREYVDAFDEWFAIHESIED